MIAEELRVLHENLMQADFPEDVFGAVSDKSALKTVYRSMARVCHPDKVNGNPEALDLAEAAFQQLNELYERAKEAFDDETYGQRKGVEEPEVFDFEIKTRRRTYHLRKVVAEGDLTTVYEGDYELDGASVSIVAKITEDSEDNDLVQNEVKVLRVLREKVDVTEYDFGKHLPVFVGQFKTTDGQVGTIWERIEGFDLFQVREKYPKGVAPHHAVWMLNRILLVLGFVHRQGVLHGNIDPSHVMVRPRDHNGWLVDWSYAIEKPKSTGQGFRVWNPDYSAPEVRRKESPLPSSDLYSLGKVMIYVLGGDVKTASFPDEVDVRLQRFIRSFCEEDVRTRRQDSWEAREALTKLRRSIFGPDRFRDFRM